MAKFYGKVGYVETVETRPGVFTQSVTERTYCGDLVRNSRKWQTSGNVNDDVNVNNEISIVADTRFADNKKYSYTAGYDVVVVETDPDRKLATDVYIHFVYCREGSPYVSNNLYHSPFIIYF